MAFNASGSLVDLRDVGTGMDNGMEGGDKMGWFGAGHHEPLASLYLYRFECSTGPPYRDRYTAGTGQGKDKVRAECVKRMGRKQLPTIASFRSTALEGCRAVKMTKNPTDAQS